jgi:hypothetical protein
MFRIIMMCVLVAATTAGCAQMRASSVQPYYTVGSQLACSEFEGSGDCQPAAGIVRLSKGGESAPAADKHST